MNHLRLANNKEFYKGDFKANFLGNIKDINIIVGANNTRKSRFLRTIINQEFNVLIEGNEQLNQAYNNSKEPRLSKRAAWTGGGSNMK